MAAIAIRMRIRPARIVDRLFNSLDTAAVDALPRGGDAPIGGETMARRDSDRTTRPDYYAASSSIPKAGELEALHEDCAAGRLAACHFAANPLYPRRAREFRA